MALEQWRPRGGLRPAREIEAEAPSGTLFMVTCSGVRYAFEEASWSAFGRDDSECTIVVWECLLATELSRVAGVLWCLDGDLWVRNVSARHELLVHGGALPQHLPPHAGRRGAACSVDDGCCISAPSTGPWRMTVDALRAGMPQLETSLQPLTTLVLLRPPVELLPTAVAMCAPLLRRGTGPATYAEIGQWTTTKPRTARDRVDRLLAFYRDQGLDRLWREWGSEGSHYGPLARLLVYRAVITRADLHLIAVPTPSS